MFWNSWFKKEAPFQGLTGFGGGSTGISLGGVGGFEATGGEKLTLPTITYHVYTPGTPTTFVVTGSETKSCRILVIGGGGGGGYFYGDGGGGGGAVECTDYSVEAGPYTIAIGAGGEGGYAVSPYEMGAKGGNSQFYPTPIGPSNTGRPQSLIAWGGGGGGAQGAPGPGQTQPAVNDPGSTGSSGGFHGPDKVTPTFPGVTQAPNSTNYSNDGWYRVSANGGVGGGGAGADAATGAPGVAGDGQAFTSFVGPAIWPALPGPIQATLGPEWESATGPQGHYAGGGHGWSPTIDGSSRVPGGGGAGTPDNAGSAGVNGTGGGGSGPVNPGHDNDGGNGIVIVRYDN